MAQCKYTLPGVRLPWYLNIFGHHKAGKSALTTRLCQLFNRETLTLLRDTPTIVCDEYEVKTRTVLSPAISDSGIEPDIVTSYINATPKVLRDMGGHQRYCSAYNTYFSTNQLVLILHDVTSTDYRTTCDCALQTLAQQTGKYTVGFVLTKADLVDMVTSRVCIDNFRGGMECEMSEYVQRYAWMTERYPALPRQTAETMQRLQTLRQSLQEAVFVVSCVKDEGIERLFKHIHDIMQATPSDSLSPELLPLYDAMRVNLPASNGLFVNPEQLYEMIGQKSGVFVSDDDPERREHFIICLRFLSLAGLVIWFESSAILKNAIFVQVSYFRHLIKSIYSWMDINQSQKTLMNQSEKQGILSIERLRSHIENLTQATESLLPVYVELLQHLNLATRITISQSDIYNDSLFCPWFVIEHHDIDVLDSVVRSTAEELSQCVVIQGLYPAVLYNYLSVIVVNVCQQRNLISSLQFSPGNLLVNLSDDMTVYLTEACEESGATNVTQDKHISLYVKSGVNSMTIREMWHIIDDICCALKKLTLEWLPYMVVVCYLKCPHCVAISETSGGIVVYVEIGRVFTRTASSRSIHRCGNSDIPEALVFPIADGMSEEEATVCVGEIKTYLEHTHQKTSSMTDMTTLQPQGSAPQPADTLEQRVTSPQSDTLQPRVTSPQHDMDSVEQRMLSFVRREEFFSRFSASELVQSGLYASDMAGEMKCVSCDFIYNVRAQMAQWNPDPVTFHEQNIGNCRFLQEQHYATGGDTGGDPRTLTQRLNDMRLVPNIPPNSTGGDNNEVARIRLPFTDYRLERSRLESYQNWPANAAVTPDDLANAGFFYTGVDDRVQCHFCRGILRNWERGDRALPEHMRHFPNCPFLQDPVHVGNVPIDEESSLSVFKIRLRPEAREPCVSDMSPADIAAENVMTGRPINVNYSLAQLRLRTFTDFPSNAWQSGLRLSEAGFFYTGSVDEVRCYYCDVRINNWQKRDDPWELHVIFSPNCGFIRLIRGPEYIQEVLAKEERVKRRKATREVKPRKKRSKAVRKYDVHPDQVKKMMASEMVNSAVQMDCHLSTVEKVVVKRLTELGDFFPNIESLVDACQEYEEESSESSDNNSDLESCDIEDVLPAKDDQAGHSVTNEEEIVLTTPDLQEVSIETLQEDARCKVCFEEEISVVFLNCSHYVCCRSCSAAVTKCPLCREVIVGKIIVEKT